MFVNRLILDKWNGVLCDEEEVSSPTLVEFEREVGRLDAEIHTLLTLEGQDGVHLAIGGGTGKYVVYISQKDDEFWNLLSIEADIDGIVLVTAGGQKGDCPARQVVGLQQALKAGSTFMVSGERDSGLRWEKQT